MLKKKEGAPQNTIHLEDIVQINISAFSPLIDNELGMNKIQLEEQGVDVLKPH